MFNSRQGIEIQRKIQTAKERRELDIWFKIQIQNLPAFDCWHGHPPKISSKPSTGYFGAPVSISPDTKWDGIPVDLERGPIE
jgi:hypothetical protein